VAVLLRINGVGPFPLRGIESNEEDDWEISSVNFGEGDERGNLLI